MTNAPETIRPQFPFLHQRNRKTNALDPGDTIGLTGEVTIVHDDGKGTFWLKGFNTPITLRAEPSA